MSELGIRVTVRMGAAALGLLMATTVVVAQGEIIPATEAAANIGKTRSVLLIVRSTGHAVKEGSYYLNSELNFRADTNFAVVIGKNDADRFSAAGGSRGLEKFYAGKQVRVTGPIEQLKNGTGIRISGPDKLVVTDRNPANPDVVEAPAPISDDFDPRPPSYTRYYLIGLGLLLLPIWAVLRARKKRAEEHEGSLQT